MKYSVLATAAALAASAAEARLAFHGTRDSTNIMRPVKRDSPMTGSSVGVFWGQNNSVSLSDVCSSGYYNVVFLAFVEALNPPGINLADLTGSPSDAQSAKSGWNLADFTVAGDSGTSVAEQVSGCQSAGIKVMATFGGTTGAGDTKATFDDSDDATTSADNFWNLYLGGTDMSDLRPFGTDVTLDGIDLDNETSDGSNYDVFLKALRGYMDGDSSRTYYISADPMAGQVGNGDSTGIPASVFQYIDFLNVQFYNDETNEIGGSGFEDNIKAWDDLCSSTSPSPKLVVGIPGGDGAADYYKTADEIAGVVSDIQGMGLANLGGFSVWDAGRADSNSGFAEALKNAVSGS